MLIQDQEKLVKIVAVGGVIAVVVGLLWWGVARDRYQTRMIVTGECRVTENTRVADYGRSQCMSYRDGQCSYSVWIPNNVQQRLYACTNGEGFWK